MAGNAFENCDNATSLTIEDGVVDIDGGWAFVSLPSIKSVYIPKSVRRLSTPAFVKCGQVESFTVDDENSNFKSIGGN